MQFLFYSILYSILNSIVESKIKRVKNMITVTLFHNQITVDKKLLTLIIFHLFRIDRLIRRGGLMCAEQRMTGKIQDNHLERQILTSAVVSNVYSLLSQGKAHQGTFTVKAKHGMFVGLNSLEWVFLDIEKKLFGSASAVFRDGTEPRGQPPSSGPYKRIINEPNSDEVMTDVEIDIIIMGQVHIPRERRRAPR